MISYTIPLDEAAAAFYQQIAAQTGQPVELVLANALFQLAGELSLEALARAER